MKKTQCIGCEGPVVFQVELDVPTLPKQKQRVTLFFCERCSEDPKVAKILGKISPAVVESDLTDGGN